MLQGLLGKYIESRHNYSEKMEEYNLLIDKLDKELIKLAALENGKSKDFDACAETMGNVLEIIVVYFIENMKKIDMEQKGNVCQIAKDLGKWVYLIDAYDDLEKDIRKKNFNPLIGFITTENFEDTSKVLNRSVAMLELMRIQIGKALKKLKLYSHEDIIYNILGDGLKKIVNTTSHKKQWKIEQMDKVKNAYLTFRIWYTLKIPWRK